MRKKKNDRTERVSHAEQRISCAKDKMTNLQAKIHMLEKKNKSLEEKQLDLEARSRLNTPSLANLPEGAKGKDPTFLSRKWIPDTLGTAALQSSVDLNGHTRSDPRDNLRHH